MKQKEIKNLAKKIAQQQIILLKEGLSLEEKSQAEAEIMRLSSGITSLEDMIAIDEIVLNLLTKNS